VQEVVVVFSALIGPDTGLDEVAMHVLANRFVLPHVDAVSGEQCLDRRKGSVVRS
jgi:hypothetical protein